MRFRQATPDDLEEMLGLIARCDADVTDWVVSDTQAEEDRQLLGRRVRDGSIWTEVAVDGDAIVGLVNFWPRRTGVARLGYLFVDPARQGAGIGRELLERATAEMRSRGFERSDLITQEPNTHARRFYERAGWRETGERVRHKGFDCLMVAYEIALHP
jgi:ribosomal protein S18 acetylase RimI-like enzyme